MCVTGVALPSQGGHTLAGKRRVEERMSEAVAGTREFRGEWEPAKRPAPAPLWAWPPRPLGVLRWIFGFPGYLFPWNAIYCLLAIATWLYTQPELSRMAEFRLDWIAQIYFRNFALLVLFAGGLHLRLYTVRGQGSKFKFNPKWLGEKNPTFLWGNQLRDNIFWSVASGCTVWTAYEVLMMWAYANGMTSYVDWGTEPVYCALLLCALLLWHVVHFYFTHRLLHWRPLYRSAHYVHHKNVNIGPWSGLAMHPIEHIIYFSGVLIFWIVPSHPIHALFALQFAALAPASGHSGFERAVVKGKVTLPGDFFHYLHHRYFECNYGSPNVPFDRWFGSFHDGSPEAHAQMKERWGKRRA
jgi:sterol desaturase/sphingolipid hydroxylase (fatty acid hydroxylase superfamily)